MTSTADTLPSAAATGVLVCTYSGATPVVWPLQPAARPNASCIKSSTSGRLSAGTPVCVTSSASRRTTAVHVAPRSSVNSCHTAAHSVSSLTAGGRYAGSNAAQSIGVGCGLFHSSVTALSVKS